MKIYATNHILYHKYDHIMAIHLYNSDHNFIFYDLNSVPFEDNSCLFVNQNDLFELDEQILISIGSVKNKKMIFINHMDCYSNQSGLDDLYKIKEKFDRMKFDEKDIFFITQLLSDKKNINLVLGNVEVFEYDRWLFEYDWYDIKELTPRQIEKIIDLDHKRFSMFIRRIDKNTHLRPLFFYDLISKNLLKEFHFTLTDLHTAYVNQDGICIKDMANAKTFLRQIIPSDRYDDRSIDMINQWIDNFPYELGNDLGSPYPGELKYFFEKSDINIPFETMPLDVADRIERYGSCDTVFAKSIISEKIYKSMYHKKPFIVISQPYALEYLRESGYKTFDPLIDESYDRIEKYDDRISCILSEIERIANLPEQEYKNILNDMTEIVEHNYNVLMQKINTTFPEHILNYFK